ncbi:DUF6493 family protein [Lentzea sp.]|uniref:DUF6493 family protein n=1 Tax=Lentzea sp. TaxID=56099 RepID=UPI002D0490E7|nr:DUF6493 family protein [Lentzea sp.]HUQ59226.1 DUF6493 family protein [Lentzea sp.]
MSFERIQALIVSRELLALGEVLKNLTAEERKECAKELVAFEKKHRAGSRSWEHFETLAVAGAGLLPSASALTPWLMRYQTWWDEKSPLNVGPVLLDVLRSRELPWMPDLVARLGAKMPSRDLSRLDVLRVVLEFCGEDPPDSDGFLSHLMTFDGHRWWRPGFDALIPRMLEVAGAGQALASDSEWLALLIERGERRVLLDGCLARLQQGGGVTEMQGFLALHDVLQVTPDEMAEHVKDYVAMLPDSRSTVATLAQDRLKQLDEAGRLDVGLLCEASRWVFGRGEKKLVRTQLTWLGKHAKSTPDDVVLTVADLFSHESDDLRGQAVKLIAAHLAKISDATRTELLALAGQLPADLAGRLGGVAAQQEAVALVPFTPQPWPEPITTLDELTREVLGLFGRDAGHIGGVPAERVVEAVVRFAWQDREALAKAFAPVYDKHPWILNRTAYDVHRDHARRTAHTEFLAILAAVSAPPRQLGAISSALDFARDWRAQMKRAGNGDVHEQLTQRLHEIEKGLIYAPRPALVSTPTEMSGLLDPAVLAERLAKAEAEGWEPWQRDLRQAFHRLPPTTGAGEFEPVPGKAAAKVREWCETRTDPAITVEERTYRSERYWRDQAEQTITGLLAVVVPGLEEPEKRPWAYDEWGPMIEWWPSVLPARREVVAAHLVPHFRARTMSKGGDGPLLPMLAEASGPAGQAVHLALAYGLGAELTVNRAYAVDAVLVLAARDQLDGKVLGDLLGRLFDRGDLVVSRVVPGLRDTARSGAAQQVWDVVATALPKLWTHNRVADVVELAVELAQQLKPGGDVDGLADVAARKGSSKVVVQAKRLVSALA